jgi:gluconate kinase
MIYWFLGYPGVGKDYLAKLLSTITPVRYINADKFLTKTEKEKIKDGTFNSIDRLKKLKRICIALKRYSCDISIGDTLPNQKSRIFLSKNFKNKIVFILVKTSHKKHLHQLKRRKNHFFKLSMLDTYINSWDNLGTLPHLVLDTTKLNKIKLKTKLLKIYKNSKKRTNSGIQSFSLLNSPNPLRSYQ